MNKINLGDTVRDTVTGFWGVATSRVQYINGCVQYGVQPPVDKDNKMPDAQYLDEGRCQLVKAAVEPLKAVPSSGPGGPQGSSTPSGAYKG